MDLCQIMYVRGQFRLTRTAKILLKMVTNILLPYPCLPNIAGVDSPSRILRKLLVRNRVRIHVK